MSLLSWKTFQLNSWLRFWQRVLTSTCTCLLGGLQWLTSMYVQLSQVQPLWKSTFYIYTSLTLGKIEFRCLHSFISSGIFSFSFQIFNGYVVVYCIVVLICISLVIDDVDLFVCILAIQQSILRRRCYRLSECTPPVCSPDKKTKCTCRCSPSAVPWCGRG